MTTFKLHLCARVPNEGARRLAWWLGVQVKRGVTARRPYTATTLTGVPAAYLDLEQKGQLGPCEIDRLLAGELIPGADMAWRISLATGGEVLTSDWRDPARGGWGERPVLRTMFSPYRRCVIDDPNRGGSFAGAWARALRQTGRDPAVFA